MLVREIMTSPAFSVDELQGLMLQISFAIMMVFMIAYFMFRTQSTREQDERVLELQKQKLVAAPGQFYVPVKK